MNKSALKKYAITGAVALVAVAVANRYANSRLPGASLIKGLIG